MILCSQRAHVYTRIANSPLKVPTRPICRQPTAIVGQFPSADSRDFRISNMFDMDSRLTIVKSVIESADSGIKSADSTVDSASNLLRIGL